MSPYHRGELAAQERAGLRVPAGNAERGIRGSVPGVAAAFLAQQPVIVIGAADDAGRMWTTLLIGPPGFIHALDPGAVCIATRPVPPDPLAGALARPAQVGMIAVEPATRRRIRINGRTTPDGSGLRVDVDQVIGNCPKYIQQRVPDGPADAASAPALVYRGSELTAAQQQMIRSADTFFVSTAADDGSADASHRGGNPGFVRVPSATRVSWPDYLGNAMLLTLGNLELRPAAGLLFVDWTNGSTLHLSGTAVVDYSPERAATFPGAQRVVDLTVTDVVEISGLSPLRWSAPEFSRFNPLNH